MEVVVRPAVSEDLELFYCMLCDLEKEVLDKTHFTEIYHTNLANPAIGYFIAELNGDPVGIGSCHVQLLLHHASPVGEIQEMYVDPSVRSWGIGQEIIKTIRQFATKHGANQLEVTTNKIRLETHRFYEREGFQKTHDKLVWKGIK